MKNYIKSLLVLAFVCVAMGFTSCSNSDAEKDEGKTPFVEYVRMCEPTQSDSLLVAANMGQRIAFIGANLGDVQQVWFNDQKAKLNPTLVTSNAIIVDVPNVISDPENVTNKVRMITSKGIEYTYDFKVIVPNPIISTMSCEYGKAGDKITISGNYFIGSTDEVLVFFPGVAVGVKPESFTQTEIVVTVPDGVQEGYLKVQSMYGTSRYAYKFMDTTGLITSFDDGYVNPWGRPDAPSGVLDNGISGKYLNFYCKQNGAWNWSNQLMWGYWAAYGKGNQPIATGDISKLALKFECKINTWSDCPLLIWFAKYNAGGGISPDDSYAQAHWKPWNKNGEKTDAKTNGWITVTIPLTDFKYNKEESETNLSIKDISQYTELNVMMFGAADGPSDVDICFDNFRIVTIE